MDTASITIPRPIDEVFAFVTDIQNMPLWVSGVSSARMVTEEMGEGARFSLEYVNGWRPSELVIQVIRYEPPIRFDSRTSRGPFLFDGRMELVEEGSETLVTNIIEAGPDSLSTKVASVLFGRWLRKSFANRLQSELEQLRNAISGMPSHS